jgi:hypothetical protein
MIDLDALRERLRAALPQLSYEMADLEHSETHDRHPALVIETAERKKDCVYRMTITLIGDRVNFFIHVFGASKDLTTQGAQQFSKADAEADEVFAIVHSCWTKDSPS